MKLPLFIGAMLPALVLCIIAGDADAFGKRRPDVAGLRPPVIGIGQHHARSKHRPRARSLRRQPPAIGIRRPHAQFKRRPKRSDGPGPGLMPPSVAAKLAQRVAGGKILGVHLRGLVYHVKLRGNGRVRTVRVHAVTGRVLGH